MRLVDGAVSDMVGPGPLLIAHEAKRSSRGSHRAGLTAVVGIVGAPDRR